MKSVWITHKGRPILYCDFRDFGRDARALSAEIDAADAEICAREPGSVLSLADLRGTVTSAEVVSLFKHSATLTKKHVHRQAVVGITGVQRVLAQAVSRFSGQAFALFDTVDAAKDWLVD